MNDGVHRAKLERTVQLIHVHEIMIPRPRLAILSLESKICKEVGEKKTKDVTRPMPYAQ